mgnify:CR=1 FL=1
MNAIQHEIIVAEYERKLAALRSRNRTIKHEVAIVGRQGAPHPALVGQLEDCQRKLAEVERQLEYERTALDIIVADAKVLEAQRDDAREDAKYLRGALDTEVASANRWFALAMLSEGVHECKYFSCTEA